jgi:hypothetical protein
MRIPFHIIRYRIPGTYTNVIHESNPGSSIFSNCGSESGFSLGSRVLMTKNWKKFKAGKNSYFFIKKCNYFSRGLYKGRLSYRRSLGASKENIQPATQINADPCGSETLTLTPDTDSVVRSRIRAWIQPI